MVRQITDSTRTAETYEMVRSDILNGKLRPGERLQVATLCKSYEVSSGVLREVLPRLVGEGLATSEPQLGFSVVSISIDDLLEITECRLTIEAMTLRQAIEHGDLHWESRVLAAHHVLANTALLDNSGQGIEWSDAHANFHNELLSGSPNEHLCSVARSLRELSEVYQNWTDKHSRRQGSQDEHQTLLDAALSRDAETAVRQLTDHIQKTAAYLVAQQQPPGQSDWA